MKTSLHEKIYGTAFDLLTDYRDDNIVEQGFIFRRANGAVCGCGESFIPLNSTKMKLGW